MPHIGIEIFEQYPAFALTTPEEAVAHGLPVHEVDQETLDRWVRVEAEHARMHQEMDRLVNPRCPECDHPQARHQEWSPGWDTWGCLAKVSTPERGEFATRTCRCQHGLPEGR